MMYQEGSPASNYGVSLVGGYDLHLYCSKKNDSHSYNEFPHQYSGEKKSDAKKDARDDGWVFHRDGSVSCPKCSNK